METREWVIRDEKKMRQALVDYMSQTQIDMGPQKAIIVEIEYFDDGCPGLRIKVAPLVGTKH